MRKLSFTLLLIILILPNLNAQSDSSVVNLKVWVQCIDQGTVLATSTELKEGQIYTLEPATLPSSYSNAQPIYDAFVGSQFYFEYGAIPQDTIELWYILSNIDCSVDTAGFIIPNFGITEVFYSAQFLVFADDELISPYNFANDKKAVVKIFKTPAMLALIQNQIPNPNAVLQFFYDLTTYFDSTGIETIITPEYFMARVSHFSKLTGGDRSILTNPTSVEDNNLLTPAEFKLLQNYPNPFNPTTVISYTVPEKSNVTVKVYNILGVEVATLVNGEKEPGLHSVSFNAKGLSSGMYIYELNANGVKQSRKMIYIK